MLSHVHLLGLDVVLNGRVFGGQAERVPAHRVQHVEPRHALKACDHVADGVIAHVPHVQPARRIGEHLQAVILGPGVIRPPGRAALSHRLCHFVQSSQDGMLPRSLTSFRSTCAPSASGPYKEKTVSRKRRKTFPRYHFFLAHAVTQPRTLPRPTRITAGSRHGLTRASPLTQQLRGEFRLGPLSPRTDRRLYSKRGRPGLLSPSSSITLAQGAARWHRVL